jgi:hypothetical protein
MKLHLDFDPELSVHKLEIGDKVTLLGSCFSDEMAIQLNYNGFHVCSNLFGTIFHPTALANVLLTDDFKSSIIQRDDLFFSYVGSGSVYGLTAESLEEELNVIQQKLFLAIRDSRFLFVTFGTAFGYENENYGSVVANCHKLPSTYFSKVLSSVGEMAQDWEMSLARIYELNPTIQVVFTVSPVRHIKDGLVENNRSKARLIELTNRLSEMTDAIYFPSYELVNDVLRDYRFFKEDLIHPSSQAIDFVYENFEKVFLSQDTRNVTQQIRKLRELQNHTILYPDSVKSTEFEWNTKNKIEKFLRENPTINW